MQRSHARFLLTAALAFTTDAGARLQVTTSPRAASRGSSFWVGPNSKQGPRAQPPDVADVVLHETAISWLRVEEEQTRPTRPWEETPKQLAVRLQRGVSRINKDFDVRGLCMEFPDRLHTLVKKKGGDRLPK